MRFTSLGNTVGSSATVYRESDLGGLEICQRRLAERTGARGYIIVTERFVFGRFNCVVGRFRSIIIKKYFMHTSNCRKKEVRSVVLYASTIGRPAYDIIKDVTAASWNRNELATHGSILIIPYQTLCRRIALGIEETWLSQQSLKRDWINYFWN